MNNVNTPLMRKALLLLAAVILAGCVSGQYLHEQGLYLLDEGKTEEGLAKLEAAVKADPDNVSYRASLARNREQAINRRLMTAYAERMAGHPDAAQAEYKWVLKIDPRNSRAKDGLAALEMDKRHKVVIEDVKALIKKGELAAAGEALKTVIQENPDQEEALLLQRKVDELTAREQSAGPSLMAKFKKPVTLEFRDANVKMVFEALSRVSGINVLLDKDVKPDLKTSISVKNASVEDTIDLIMLQNQLEKKILNDTTVFVYPKTADKNKEYQELQVRSFHLSNADPKVLVTMIKTLLKTKDIFVNEKTNSIIMRDTPDAISLAEKMVADQDVPDPEVMMEVEVLEVSRARLDQLGINWPNTITLTAGNPGGTGAASTLGQLQQVNRNSILVSPAMAATLDLMLQDSDTNILASPRIRARNHEKAKIMVGDRVPVITNAVTPLSTGSQVVTGSVTYLDVGLKLEVEPDIHTNNEVAIKVNMDVSTITNTIQNASGTVAYAVGTRNASTQLQLKDGETQILAGLIDNESRATVNKVPGIGQLPILGHLFSDQGDNNKKTEIVLSITPHIVGRIKTPDARETKYWSGTEATLRNGQLMLKPIGNAVNGSESAAVPAGQPVVLPPLALAWQGPVEAKVGDKIGVTLNAQSAQGVNDLGLQLSYDPAVFRVADVVEGNLIKHNNTSSRFTKSIDQANGQATIEIAATSPNGSAGSGSVITVVLEAIAPAPQSRLTLSRVTPKGSGGQVLAYTPTTPFTMAVSKGP